MNVLLLGSGGREHALSFKLSKSPLLTKLFIAPGNPGTAEFGTNVVLDVKDHAAIIQFCKIMKIELVVVGPEAPLVAGLIDDLTSAGIKAFGPNREAAQLEGSKNFVKQLCREFNIPTAAYESFTNAQAAKAYITKTGAPIVVKYDGLMAGKGVTVASSVAEAHAAIDAIFTTEPNSTQDTAMVVIEECLVGEEISFFCLSDGETVLPFGSAQDHKRAYDGDTGPNTGGMGAYSPAPAFTPALEQRTLDEIIKPTIAAMKSRGTPYKGVLFAGLMLTSDGPKLIEYNVRFGDPECQVLMLRLQSDLLAILLACSEQKLVDVKMSLSNDFALTIVMAAKGYPASYETGTLIQGVDDANAVSNVKVFHAGTKLENGRLLSNGGRVLNVTASAPTISQAREYAYAAIAKINWPNGFYRKDIAWRALQH
jgi:phosphoribosylamine---glycine ligase